MELEMNFLQSIVCWLPNRYERLLPEAEQQNAFEQLITETSQRETLLPPARGYFFASFELAGLVDNSWNYGFRENSRRSTVTVIGPVLVLLIGASCDVVAGTFMGKMIEIVGWNSFTFTFPMFWFLEFSLILKFALVAHLDRGTRLLFLSRTAIILIVVLTVAFAVISSIPYDYFFSTEARESTNHVDNNIWKEKMWFISFHSTCCMVVSIYIQIFLLSLVNERGRILQNYSVYSSEEKGNVRPIHAEPSLELLRAYFQAINDFMRKFEIVIALDIVFAMFFACLLGGTYWVDKTIGPCDTSMAFIMAYQFVIPLISFCEINRIHKKVSERWNFQYHGQSVFNSFTTYELFVTMGLIAALLTRLLKLFFGFTFL